MFNRINNFLQRRFNRSTTPAPVLSENTQQQGNQIIQERETSKATVVPCSTAQYRQAVSELGRPSDAQIDDFVKFVCKAHSWYKHLPILPPGIRFTFFLDPHVGMDKVLQPGGSVSYQERMDDSPKFHYTWMTTEAYHSHFGYLSYQAKAGSFFYIQTGDTVGEYADLPFIDIEGVTYHIPLEVAEVGAVELTAVIHSHLPEWLSTYRKDPLFDQGYRDDEMSPRQWPIETGGEGTLSKIVTLCDQPFNMDEYKKNRSIKWNPCFCLKKSACSKK